MIVSTAIPGVELRLCGPGDVAAVCDLIDSQLRGDAFLPRRQVAEIVSRPISSCWVVVVEEEVVGVAITYAESDLHNLILAPWVRARGVGRVVVEALKIERVRVKTNMKSGDPMGFYAALGFAARTADARRPHIVLAERAAEPPPPAVTGDCHQPEPATPALDAETRAAAAKWYASKALAAKRSRERNAKKTAERNRAKESRGLEQLNGQMK